MGGKSSATITDDMNNISGCDSVGGLSYLGLIVCLTLREAVGIFSTIIGFSITIKGSTKIVGLLNASLIKSIGSSIFFFCH